MTALWEYCYVSVPSPAAVDEDRILTDIVDKARPRNAVLGITGALIWSGAHFAQILEGERETVHALIDRIARDERHGEMRCLANGQVATRSFAEWALVFGRPSHYVERQIERAIAAATTASGMPATHQLRAFMFGMATPDGLLELP